MAPAPGVAVVGRGPRAARRRRRVVASQAGTRARSRRRRPAEVSPRERALQALAALRAETPVDAEARTAWYDALAAIVRGIAGVPEEWTTEEIAARHRGPRADELRGVLQACDLVKFAEFEPSDTDRSATLDDAEAYVREAGA